MSTSSHTRRTGFWSGALFLALAAVCFQHLPAFGQVQDARRGVMLMANWPSTAERADLNHQVLPFIDTLLVSYTYETRDDAPALSMAMEWIPSGDAVIRGALRPLSEVDVKMVAVELEAGVFVDDDRVGTISVVVDSMMVAPSPDFVAINLPNLTWSNVFVDMPAEQARSLFEEGFELRDPEFMHVAFALFEGGRGATGDASRPNVRRPLPPREVSVHGRRATVDVVFDLFWLLGGDRRVAIADRGTPRGTAGRGSIDDSPRSRSGRRDGGTRSGEDEESGVDDGEAGRDDRGADRDGDREEGRGGRGLLDLVTGNDDDDDDDDDDELVPYALAAVGAAGLLAVAGGTIGYFGNVRNAQYGITSGLVRRGGGLLLQVGVNEALLADADAPKHLLARLLAFGDVLRGNVQPAIGAGVLATSRGSELEVSPSISLGAVGRARALLLYGGYDVYQRGVEFGIALNIRELGIWRSRGD